MRAKLAAPLSFLSGLLWLVCASAAQSQTQSQTKIQSTPLQLAFHQSARKTVTVTAQRDKLTAESADDAKARLSHVPGGANVVAAEDYANKQARGFRDTLAFVPGVFAQERYGEEERLSIRGSGLSRGFHLRGLNILIDGVPLTLADNSGDFLELNSLSADYIEVYRGANALAFGAASLGGAINLVSPVGRKEQTQFDGRAEGGSFGSYRVHSAVSGGSKAFDYYVSATGAGADGYRNQSTSSAGRFNGNAGWKINDDIETRFYLTRNDIKQEVPGTLTKAQALNTPKMAPAINITNDYARDITSWRVANKTSFALSDNFQLDTGGFANLKELYHPIFQVVDQDSRDVGGFARISAAIDEHNFTLGLNGRKGTIDAKRFVNVRGRRGGLTADSGQSASEIDVYAQADLKITGSLRVLAGGQYFHATRRYDDRLVPAAGARTYYDAFNPKLGALYQVNDDIQLFTNISRSAEAPTFSELVQAPLAGFVPLGLQRAWTLEAGSRGRYKNVSWDISVFRAWLKGEMLQFSVNANVPASTFNAGHTIHQGIELGLNITLLENLFASTADRLVLKQLYNWSDYAFRNDPQFGNNAIAGAPRHFYKGEIKYEMPARFFLSANVEWVGKAPYVDFANTLTGSSYAVFGMSAGVTLAEGVDIFIDARNLADKRYVSNFSTVTDARLNPANVFYPGEARSVFAGVRLRH